MTTRSLLYRFLLLSLVALIATAGFVRAEDESSSIQKMMSPEEFKAAGLERLSPEELQKLNEWLHGYRQETVQATEKAAETKAAKEGRRKFDVIVSRVVGPFYGLTGSTIITLEDGSVWKQATRSDRIRGPGQDHLGVAVYNAGLFGYKMRIQGTPDFYVNQVRKH